VSHPPGLALPSSMCFEKKKKSRLLKIQAQLKKIIIIFDFVGTYLVRRRRIPLNGTSFKLFISWI
jgi:hypothetical protein